jgi:hypothetical protein
LPTNAAQAEQNHRRAVREIVLSDLWIYLLIAICCLGAALFSPYFNTADALSYLDISDAIRHHFWHSVVNAYFFPAYPALLLIGRAAFGFRMKYEFMAARITDAFIQMFFVACSVVLVYAVRAVARSRGAAADQLIPVRTLSVWAAVFAYILAAQDVYDIRPDALVSAFMILTAASFLLAVAHNNLFAFAAAGLFGALGEWTKAIAFPFFILCLLCVLLANLHRRRVLKGLAVTVLVYAAVAGPWIGLISKARGRFTFGDSGRLNEAWFVNGADNFNPTTDPAIYHVHDARADFKHAGTLLSRDPVTFYFNDGIYGTLPEWYDGSYWFDGLAPRFVLHDTLATIRRSMTALYRIADVHLLILVLFAAPIAFGFGLRRRSSADPVLIAMALLALALVAAYMTVLLEGRYIVFSLMMLGALFAGSCVALKQTSVRSLHLAVLLIASTVLLSQLQDDIAHRRQLQQQNGVSPLSGIYDLSVQSAGADLRSLFPQGTEVACMGAEACFKDPYWARYGGVRITGILDTSHGLTTAVAGGAGSVDGDCIALEHHPDLLNLLRKHSIRAIVTQFDNGKPCSTAWKNLGNDSSFYYRGL